MGGPVFANGMEIASEASDCKVIAAFPDVCLSPPPPPAGPIPLPYPISSFASDTADGSSTVQIGGQPAMLKDQSYYSKCTGDEPATQSQGGGLMTGCITGKVYFAMWSPDVKFEGANVDRNLDFTNGNGQSTPNQMTPWPNMGQMDLEVESAPATTNCNPGSIALDVGQTLLTLKHDRECKLEVLVEPSTISVSDYRIEIKREGTSEWCTLASQQTLDPWKAVIAGHFLLRGVATICGKEHESGEVAVQVQFPKEEEISSDGAVKAAIDAIWRESLLYATERPGGQLGSMRVELGCWILLDTSANSYSTSDVKVGQSVYIMSAGSQTPELQKRFRRAAVTIGGRPDNKPESPDPCSSGAVYAVASFHTHPSFFATPEEIAFWCEGLQSPWRRPIGPSDGDYSADASDKVPGIVYDYEGAPAGHKDIPIGHPKDSPTKLYFTNLERRPTPTKGDE